MNDDYTATIPGDYVFTYEDSADDVILTIPIEILYTVIHGDAG